MVQCILKPGIYLLLLLLFTAGCQKDDIFELHIGDENAVIIHEVDGIEFKFCLLNELGQPATIFNEGENFSFHFSIKNTRNESVSFNDYRFLGNKEFFSVYSNEKTYGKPFELLREFYTLELKWLRENEETTIVNPWVDNREEFYLPNGFYEGKNQSFLAKGKYYTQFSSGFNIGNVIIDSVTFKINFEIK